MYTVGRSRSISDYLVGTGEHGIHVDNRFRNKRTVFDSLYGMRIVDTGNLHSHGIEFVKKLYHIVGMSDLAIPVIQYKFKDNMRGLHGCASIHLNSIKLERPCIGTLVHELAHLVAWRMFKDDGHGEGFKAAYCLLHAGTYQVLGLDKDTEGDYLMRKLNSHNLL